MGRIPDHLLRLAQRVAEGRWVTIGAKADSKRPGKKKGGTPVELDGEGVIQKGPAALTGKRPSELSQSHLFTGQPHMSQRKMFAEPGDPVPPPRLDPEAKPQAQAPAKKEPKPKAKKPQNMSLLAVIRREGGISGGDFEHADFREHGLLGALNKNGFGIDDMAAMLVRGGHIIVPHGVSSPGDHLLQLLKKKTNSLLADKTSELEKDYEAYARAREEALAHGHESGDLEKVRGRGQEAGADAGTGDILEEIFGPDLGRGGEAGAEEPGDLAGDAAEPASGVDTSFDFGPAAAPKVEDKPKAEPKKAAADTPKGATLQPDGTLKTKDGTVWVRAKAGGEHSPVTDKHYKGGQWMPIHGMSKPKAEKPAEEPVGTQSVEPGEGDKERAEDMAGPRPPRERMSPEEKAERQQAKDHWDAMNQGPMKDLVWLGDYPNQKALSNHIVGTNKWQQFSQKVGEEKLKAIAQHFKDKLKEIDPSFFEDGMDKVHQSRIDYNKTFFKRAHRKENPSSAEAHYWFQTALGETPKTAADWRSVNDQLAGLVADEPAPPPAVEPEPAAKQPHEMTAAEYLRSGRPNYGDLVQTPDGKVGTLQGGGGIGSTRVKVNGVWHDRNDLKLVKRPDKDTRQNLSDEWKAKQKADLEKIEKEHGEVLHKKSMVDSAKKRLQAGTMTQDQYDKFVGSGPYKMTDAETARAEKAQAEIDAIKDRPLEFDQSVHAQAVDNALAMGKDVPANVLAEYPDLAKKYGKGKAKDEGPAAPPALDKTNDQRPKIGDKIKTRLGGSNEKEQPDFEMNLMPATKPGHFAIGQGSIKQQEIPLESFDNFIDDMTGKVSVPADSGVAEIDAVASGKAKHLGRGDDGSAFQVGDKVVKTSTVSPFIPTNPGHRTPQEGLNRLHDQTMTHNKLAEILKEKGVGGVEPLEWHEHGGRGFAVSNLLDTKAKLNAEQIAKVRDTVDAIHDAGYVVGDDIQVGLNKNGDPVIYDLGKARKQNGNDREKAYDLESDSSKFNKLAKQNGHEDLPPLRSDIKAELNRIKNSTGPFAQKIRDRLQAQLQQLDAGAPQQSETQDEKVQRLYSEYQDAEAAKAKAKQENDFSTRLFAAGKAARARGELESLGLDPNSPPPPKPAEDKNQKLLDEYRKAKAARQAADNSDNPEDAFHADDALWNAEQALKKAGLDPAKDPQQSQGPAAPPKLNLFGKPEPTKPRPATTQGLFGEQVPVEDKKTQPQPTAADDAANGLDWLDQKQDKKTDGTGEMFGGLFSPGQQKTPEPEKPATAARASTLTDLALQKAGVAQNTDDAGLKQAGPVAPPAVEPSPTAAAARTLSLPDRIKNLNALLNKTRSRANAKALRATIAQLEREAEGSTAPPKVEPEPAGPQPKKPFSDSEDYTVEKNPNYDQWVFKAKNGKEIGEIQLKKRLSDGNFVTANVLVWPEFQRKGYATKFYKNAADYAKSQGKKLYLSKDRSKDALKLHDFFAKKGILSEDGELFPEKPAKPEPPRQPSAPPKVETAAASTGPKSQSFDDYRRENGVQGYTIDHSMLSPSGRVSGRSANAARARVNKQFSDYNQAEKEYQAKVDAGEIVDPTGKYQKPDQAKANKAEAERVREKAKNFRSIAARGMQTRKLTKQAEELERQANELDPPARTETGPVAPPQIETSKPAQKYARGITQERLDSYDPESAVTKLGKGWTVAQMSGSEFPTVYKSKAEAIQQAQAHKDFMADYLARPESFGFDKDAEDARQRFDKAQAEAHAKRLAAQAAKTQATTKKKPSSGPVGPTSGDPRNKIYAKLLSGGQQIGDNLYAIDPAKVPPQVRAKLMSDDDRKRGWPGRPVETEFYKLMDRSDVTGDPYDVGYVLKLKKQPTTESARIRALLREAA